MWEYLIILFNIPHGVWLYPRDQGKYIYYICSKFLLAARPVTVPHMRCRLYRDPAPDTSYNERSPV